MTPHAAYSDKRNGTRLDAQQIAYYTKPQLLAVWKELNSNDFEPVNKQDLQVYFIQRLIRTCERTRTPVPFALSSKTSSTASGCQQEDSPPTTSEPAGDLPQRLSYSRAAQRASDDTDRKRRECEERLIRLERASEAHDRQFEKIKRDQKSLNLFMYNIPEEGERAKNRFEAMKTLDTELNAAFKTAFNKHGDKELFAPPVAAERIGKLVADQTKPRPVRLVFSSLICKHSFLEFSRTSGKQDSDLMLISQNHNKLSEKA